MEKKAMSILTDKRVVVGKNKCVERGGGKQMKLAFPIAEQSQSSQMTNEEAECLEKLKLVIKDDKIISTCPFLLDDDFLLAFIRGRERDLDKALSSIQNFVSVRRGKYIKFFRKMSPRNFKYIMDDNIVGKRFMGILKNRDSEGCLVGVGQAHLFDPRRYKGRDMLQGLVLIGEELIRIPDGPKNGLVFVIDAAGFGLAHALEITLPRIYMVLKTFLKAYPVPYKGFHIMNNGYLFDQILTMIKKLIPKKLRQRIHLHGSDYDSLHAHVPREILPTSLKGLLTNEEAYNFDLEQEIQGRTEYYEKLAANCIVPRGMRIMLKIYAKNLIVGELTWTVIWLNVMDELRAYHLPLNDIVVPLCFT